MPVLHVEAVPADLYERIQQRAAARNHLRMDLAIKEHRLCRLRSARC